MQTAYQGDERKLFPLISRMSKLSADKKLKIVETIYIPALKYGSEIWMTTAPKPREKIQISIINKMLRLVVNADWCISSQ